MEGDIYEVNKNNASTTYIASTGLASHYLQSAYVSRVTNKTYWHYNGGDDGLTFFELNIATGETTYICQTGQQNIFILPSIMPAPESAITWSNTIIGVQEVEEAHVALYPNPTGGEVCIQAEGMRRVTVCSLQGQVVYNSVVYSDFMTLDLSQLTNGMYLVRVTTDEGSITKPVTVVR